MTPDHAVTNRPTPTVVTPVLAPHPRRPAWLALRDRPDVIHRLRLFVGAAVFGLPYTLDEVELVASEIVTNAIRAVRTLPPQPDLWPIGVEMTTTPRHAHLAVTDPVRAMAASVEGGQLAEHGRGLSIVDHLAAARWITYSDYGKTVHVVVAATDVTLTSAELQAIREAR